MSLKSQTIVWTVWFIPLFYENHRFEIRQNLVWKILLRLFAISINSYKMLIEKLFIPLVKLFTENLFHDWISTIAYGLQCETIFVIAWWECCHGITVLSFTAHTILFCIEEKFCLHIKFAVSVLYFVNELNWK